MRERGWLPFSHTQIARISWVNQSNTPSTNGERRIWARCDPETGVRGFTVTFAWGYDLIKQGTWGSVTLVSGVMTLLCGLRGYDLWRGAIYGPRVAWPLLGLWPHTINIGCALPSHNAFLSLPTMPSSPSHYPFLSLAAHSPLHTISGTIPVTRLSHVTMGTRKPWPI